MESTTCPSCGGTVPSARFCASCGQPLPVNAGVSPPSPPVPPSGDHAAAPIPTERSIPLPTPPSEFAAGREPTEAVQASETQGLPTPSLWSGATGAAADPREDPLRQDLTPTVNDDDPVKSDHAGGSRRLGIGAVTAALLAGAAYLVFGVGTEAHTLNGDLSLSATGTLSPGDACTGSGGYSDVHEGTQVIVEDENGKTLATSALGPGNYDGQSCVFTFRLSDVPKAAFYRVHQSGNRGVLQYSYQDLVGADWSVHLTLGENNGTD